MKTELGISKLNCYLAKHEKFLVVFTEKICMEQKRII